MAQTVVQPAVSCKRVKQRQLASNFARMFADFKKSFTGTFNSKFVVNRSS